MLLLIPAIQGATAQLPGDYANFFAWASVELLANQLNGDETFNHPARDSRDFQSHLKWAKTQSLDNVQKDLIVKVEKMVDIKGATSRRALYGWYADTCVALAAFGVDLGEPSANSSDHSVHFKWAASSSVNTIKRNLRDRFTRIFNRYRPHFDPVKPSVASGQRLATKQPSQRMVLNTQHGLKGLQFARPYSGAINLEAKSLQPEIPSTIAGYIPERESAVTKLYAYLSVEFIAKHLQNESGLGPDFLSMDRSTHVRFAREANLHQATLRLLQKYRRTVDLLDSRGRGTLAKWYADFSVWTSAKFPKIMTPDQASTDWIVHAEWVKDSRTKLKDIREQVLSRVFRMTVFMSKWDLVLAFGEALK